ncbi:putative sporulation protein YtxC [Heliobacterium chlorum]|uniref:Sporulation protein YtxC n=1 Tax=Heliobacterium chlorum TaxID=2698 RepID=A0ABR7T1K8_HELCL|nr:putative sporulation protein YtxC [Heliobacterium chlorum]MBC9783729.1 putative sporulation protein YtxC [Heliobacterium chlorum]
MVQILSIGASRDLDELGYRLTCELTELAGEGWQFGTRRQWLNGVHQFSCYLDEHPEGESPEEMALILRQYCARMLTDWILDVWEQELVEKRINSEYAYFSEEERWVIAEKATQILKQEEETSKEYIIYRVGRRQRILERLLDVLVTFGRVHIDGFLRFRLSDYLATLSDSVDVAVDEYMMEKEYKEFVSLLRYFLEIQDTRVPVVHVYMRPGGFQLLDERGIPVNNEIVEGFHQDVIKHEEICFEDLLISALVTVAPVQVVIHYTEGVPSSESMQTIQAVFGDRLHYCPGCDRCLVFQENVVLQR